MNTGDLVRRARELARLRNDVLGPWDREEVFEVLYEWNPKEDAKLMAASYEMAELLEEIAATLEKRQ